MSCRPLLSVLPVRGGLVASILHHHHMPGNYTETGGLTHSHLVFVFTYKLPHVLLNKACIIYYIEIEKSLQHKCSNDKHSISLTQSILNNCIGNGFFEIGGIWTDFNLSTALSWASASLLLLGQLKLRGSHEESASGIENLPFCSQLPTCSTPVHIHTCEG